MVLVNLVLEGAWFGGAPTFGVQSEQVINVNFFSINKPFSFINLKNQKTNFRKITMRCWKISIKREIDE